MNEDSTEHTLSQTERKNYALQRLVTDAMDILADNTDVSLLLQNYINVLISIRFPSGSLK